MKPNILKLAVFIVIIVLVALFFVLDLHQYLTLSQLKSKQDAFEAFYTDHSLLTIAVFMGIYIVVTALSLPGAAVMTLAGGALFGLWVGLIAVSFASSIGATLVFIVARFLVKDPDWFPPTSQRPSTPGSL